LQTDDRFLRILREKNERLQQKLQRMKEQEVKERIDKLEKHRLDEDLKLSELEQIA